MTIIWDRTQTQNLRPEPNNNLQTRHDAEQTGPGGGNIRFDTKLIFPISRFLSPSGAQGVKLSVFLSSTNSSRAFNLNLPNRNYQAFLSAFFKLSFQMWTTLIIYSALTDTKLTISEAAHNVKCTEDPGARGGGCQGDSGGWSVSCAWSSSSSSWSLSWSSWHQAQGPAPRQI